MLNPGIMERLSLPSLMHIQVTCLLPFVTIYYRDAKWRRTSRMIEPRELEVDPYTGGIGIRA